MKKSDIQLIEREVLDFRRTNGLSTTQNINLHSLLLKLDVLTIFRPLDQNFSGMSLKSSTNDCFVLINSNHSKGRQHFTIAHELYHLFIEKNPAPHKCLKTSGKKELAEQKADCFASLLLLPKDGILELIPKEECSGDNVTLHSILKLEYYFSVSRQAMLHRLLNLGLLSKPKFEQFGELSPRQTALDYGFSTELYEAANKNRMIGDYGAKARQLYEAEKISEGHYQELLNQVSYND